MFESVYTIFLRSSWCGITRGLVIPDSAAAAAAAAAAAVASSGEAKTCSSSGRNGSSDLPDRSNLYIGIGRMLMSRSEVFRSQNGVAIEMQQRVFDVPSWNGGPRPPNSLCYEMPIVC